SLSILLHASLNFSLFMSCRPHVYPLFPYTSLFRSRCSASRSRSTSASDASRRGPISASAASHPARRSAYAEPASVRRSPESTERSEEHTAELQSRGQLVCRILRQTKKVWTTSRAPI